MLRFFIVYMTTFIRYRNLTSELIFIKNFVFGAMFFNSGCIILFATFSFPESFKILNRIFPGIYSNFNSFWFEDVGAEVVTAMLINFAVPCIKCVVFYLLQYKNKLME